MEVINSMAPRVALCLQYSLGQHGGVEVLVRELIKGLSRDFSIIVVSKDETKAVMSGALAPFITDHVPWSGERPNSVESKAVALALQERGVQIAHFHLGGIYEFGTRTAQSSPIYHCSHLRLPLLMTTHGAFSVLDYCGPKRPLWYKIAFLPWAWLNRMLILNLVHRDIAVSQYDYRLMRRSFFPLQKKLDYLYHATTRPELLAPVKNREHFILHVGTIGWRKGQIDLVRAFGALAPRFPDWKLMLVGRVGDESVMAAINAHILEYGLAQQITLRGGVSEDEKYDLMTRAAIFAMPSHWEGLGLSLQEALSYGCPAVGYAAGGITELIDHEQNGLLIPPGDLAAFGAGLERLISDPALREKFAINAKESIIRKGMTTEAMVDHYSTIYRSMLFDPLATVTAVPVDQTI